MRANDEPWKPRLSVQRELSKLLSELTSVFKASCLMEPEWGRVRGTDGNTLQHPPRERGGWLGQAKVEQRLIGTHSIWLQTDSARW